MSTGDIDEAGINFKKGFDRDGNPRKCFLNIEIYERNWAVRGRDVRTTHPDMERAVIAVSNERVFRSPPWRLYDGFTATVSCDAAKKNNHQQIGGANTVRTRNERRCGRLAEANRPLSDRRPV